MGYFLLLRIHFTNNNNIIVGHLLHQIKKSYYLCKRLIDGEEYTWDATFKEKYWLDEPKEFVNIYKDGEIVYDVQLEEHIDGSPALRFGEASDVASPAAVFLKAE